MGQDQKNVCDLSLSAHIVLGKTSHSSSSKPLSNFVSVCLEIWGWFRAVMYFLFQTRPQTHASVDFNSHSVIAVGPCWF